MDVGTTLTIANLALLLVLEAFNVTWVWYQVNRRGPERSKALVRSVLSDPETWKTVPAGIGLMKGGHDPRAMGEIRAEKMAGRTMDVKARILDFLTGKFGLVRARQIYGLIPEDLITDAVRAGQDRWMLFLPAIMDKATKYEREATGQVSGPIPMTGY